MSNSSISARCLVTLLDQISEGKLELSKMATAIREAPDAAFREKVDGDGNLLLHKAIRILRRGNQKTLMYLIILTEILRKDQDCARMTNGLGQLPLHLMCDHGMFKSMEPIKYKCIIELLLKAYPDSTVASDNKGYVPLHHAVHDLQVKDNVWLKDPEIFKGIITEASSQAQDNEGWTPLHHFATVVPCKDLVLIGDLLLTAANTASLKVTCNRGDLPIHCSARAGSLLLFQRLVKMYPESLEVRNGSGKLPVEVATSHVKEFIVRFYGRTLPPSADLSESLAWCIFDNNEEEASMLMSRMPADHFPRALDQYLKKLRIEVHRRKIISNAVGEFATKLIIRQMPLSTTWDDESSKRELVAAKTEVEELKQNVKEITDRSSKLVKSFDQEKARTATLEKQVNEGKAIQATLEKQIGNLKEQIVLQKTDHTKTVKALKEHVNVITLTSSELEMQASQGKERILELEETIRSQETNCTQIIESSKQQGKDREAKLERKVADLKNALELEKGNSKDSVCSMQAALRRLMDNFPLHAKARGPEKVLLASNLPSDTNILTAIGQSLDDRLTKMSATKKTSMAQRYLHKVLHESRQPGEEELGAAIRGLSVELSIKEDEIAKANKLGRDSTVPGGGIKREVVDDHDEDRREKKVRASPDLDS